MTTKFGEPERAATTYQYATTKEIHEITRISVKHLEAMRAKRIGPPWRKIGRTVVYRLDLVYSWVEEHAVDLDGGVQ